MPSDRIGDLKKWVAEVGRRRNEGETVRLNRAVELIAKNFGVQNHEVAILALTPDERSLRFLAPDNLRTVGQIPLSGGSSLAARTARDKRPELINHFSVVPHASVFEAVPLSEEHRGEQIHKIMSAPMMLGAKLVGVLQVSRKASLISEAGPDFTQAQLRELKIIADAVAPCVLVFNAE
jgi:transcriptional regulator with GAF, ATPase, and Fis domain